MNTKTPEQVHVTQLADGKPLCVPAAEVWYGRPWPTHVYSTALLRRDATPGDVPYHRVSGARFAHEIRIEDGINQKAGRS